MIEGQRRLGGVIEVIDEMGEDGDLVFGHMDKERWPPRECDGRQH
jgi:hypothetical protein